jgi:hypothetical protein
MRMRNLLAIAAASILALSFAACDGDGGGDETPTRSVPTAATVSGTAVADETPSGEIRERDLESDAAVQELIQETGGEYVQENVIYADLSEDGVDDAVVPISSGGTLGNVGFIVLTPTEGGTATLLRELPSESGGIALNVVDGELIALEPVFGPDDPECCPSMLRQTTYAWNGAALALIDQQTIENPGGEVKPDSSQ